MGKYIEATMDRNRALAVALGHSNSVGFGHLLQYADMMCDDEKPGEHYAFMQKAMGLIDAIPKATVQELAERWAVLDGIYGKNSGTYELATWMIENENVSSKLIAALFDVAPGFLDDEKEQGALAIKAATDVLVEHDDVRDYLALLSIIRYWYT